MWSQNNKTNGVVSLHNSTPTSTSSDEKLPVKHSVPLHQQNGLKANAVPSTNDPASDNQYLEIVQLEDWKLIF